MRRSKGWKLLLTGVAASLMVLDLAPAGAASANISHPYSADGNVPSGSLVTLSAGQTNHIELANTNNAARLLGVAIKGSDSLIAVDAGKDKVQVATSGNAPVLVSTLDGNINVGDFIAASPFNGIGMKALPDSRIIGLAQTSFSPASPDATTEQVKDKKGHLSSIRVGYVQVSIAIGTDTSDASLSSLQRAAQAITGQPVSNFRVIMSLAVLLAALVAFITLIYASIYSGILAIGRNPLARQAVFRSLGFVLLMAGVTAGVSGGVIFLLLR